MYKNSSIKTKLLSGFGVLALLSGMLGFVGYLSVAQSTDKLKDIGVNSFPSIVGLSIINEEQRIIVANENALLAMNIDDTRRQMIFKSFDEALKNIAEGRKLHEQAGSSYEEIAKYKTFISAWDKWLLAHNDFVTLTKAYEASPTVENYNKMSDQALFKNAASLSASHEILEEIISINVKGVEDSFKEGIEEGTSDQITSIVLSIVAISLALFIGLYMSNYIAKSLNKVSEDLRESSIQVASASEELSNAATGLSNSSSGQASSVEETSASLEEISGMIQNNVTHAEQAFNLSNKVKDVSEIGNQNMEKLEASMKEILLSNEKIEQLVKVIANIGEKTQVMDEIVFQTKLLSFNASVEAERAGEHGRGFAVVAQEVGNLAKMSGKAAKEIADIVKESIKNTEIITAENKKRVEQGNSYVIETGENLKEIMGIADAVSIGAKQVLDASKDQAKGIDQINSAMGHIDKSTQENAATAEETASNSEELSAQTEVLNSVVEELMKLVNGNGATQTNGRTNSHVSDKRNLSKTSIIKRTESTANQKKKEFMGLTKSNIRERNIGMIVKRNGNGNFKADSNVEVDSRGESGWDSI